MLIQRCAWHAFFRGYPRPLRVLSWHGRRIDFSDSICPSCAHRVRIEGLWGSPPPPVWPGSPQTALIFVGLPLLTALVLLATPLHDATAPPMPRQELTTAFVGDLPGQELRLVDVTRQFALPRAVIGRQRTDRVPPVVYEARRTVYRSREHASAAAMPAAVVRPPAVGARTTAAAFIPESP
jgi:hypothetical protein